MSDLEKLEPPADTLYVTAETVTVTLAAEPDGQLNFGLLIQAGPPLGCTRIRMCRDQVLALRDWLNELAGLDSEQVQELLRRIRGQQPPAAEPQP